MASKPSLPKGTRDFGPEVMMKRNFIINTIKSVFEKYGFMPLETPSMENLSVLTGKYGDEGDQLLFRILNSGDFLNKTNERDYKKGSKDLSAKISNKGLRYDLTVPLARYVVMHQNDIAFPFKRYQIQPVWRADRPQKGRYREFYQCDADVLGTPSLICEVEIILMINEIFKKLSILDFTIKLNHRKILTGITEAIGAHSKESDFAVAIDKLDKIGKEKVWEDLASRGFSQESLQLLEPVLDLAGEPDQILQRLNSFFGSKENQGLSDLQEILSLIADFDLSENHIKIDPTLARGLSYYTGTILEVVIAGSGIGSVSGGGRYDNLAGAFGFPDVSGVGFSFGVDRLYDVMEALELFPGKQLNSTEVMIANFDPDALSYGLQML
ncbi:MAG: histidine--tRNA ligase, partial [Cyclobacteriaceae bacterium]